VEVLLGKTVVVEAAETTLLRMERRYILERIWMIVVVYFWDAVLYEAQG
jgi:hypothetical protein